MKYRLVTLISFVIAVTAIAVTTHQLNFGYSSKPTIVKKLPPRAYSYLGVYEDGAPPGFGPVAHFASVVGHKPNLVGYYSGWAQPFDTSFADLLNRHGAIPFVQIDPTLASVSGIAGGAYDDYLRSYAESVRDYGHAVVIGFGHEMNAYRTYSWGDGRIPAPTFVAAWRHIWDVFRQQGAQNVTWLWTINQDRPGSGRVANWWPGAKYVTWVGIDGYYVRPSDTFTNVFGTTIDAVRHFTRKPILLSEAGVGPSAGAGFLKIANLFSGMRKYQTLGLVWFDENQRGGLYRQDWRIENNSGAESEFILGLSGMSLTQSPP
jgi:Glycosyl hydrolase family 26